MPNRTSNPETFRKRWHEHVETLSLLKQTLGPEQWDDLKAATDELHDLIDDAADDIGEN